MSLQTPQESHQCDVLPAPRLAASLQADPGRSPSPPASFDSASGTTNTTFMSAEQSPDDAQMQDSSLHSSSRLAPATRKLCVRHQRMADEGTNIKLQQSLDALPVEERETVNAIWSSFSSSPHPRRELILRGILTMCCFSQLSLLTEQLSQLIRIDPFTVLPREISFKIPRISRRDFPLQSCTNDNILWRGICEQHIGQKCHKCGWGLPVLERRRNRRLLSASPLSPPPPTAPKREITDPTSSRPSKRLRAQMDPHSQAVAGSSPSPPASRSSSRSSRPGADPPDPTQSPGALTRPWKDVYSERLTIERNWRRGRCQVRTLRGHSDGVMCLQFSETLQHPSFPIIITGSYDRTVRIWNLEAGTEVRCLRGHTRAVRCLQFDEAKLITGSMDHTIRVWNWRKGECIRTLRGHTDGVVCVNFDANVLASGSVDSTVRVWNFCTGEAFTLRGHRDWVNAVKLWDATGSTTPQVDPCESPLRIGTGKMLFSASDDGTIRLWDLARRTCVQQFAGHVGQVQSLRLLELDDGCDEDVNVRALNAVRISESAVPDNSDFDNSDAYTVVMHNDTVSPDHGQEGNVIQGLRSGSRSRKPVLVSGSLDNTIKVWDVETGQTVTTLFGHIEGVWAVACDKLRLVSASHDRTVKVWNLEEGKCTATLSGHRGAVTCIALGEDKIVSGSDDGDVRIWSFSG
ncbi:WD40-repeat-containing domain protein [Pisolithus orientalis]|uniref:WD40-repeat-containing domain protein n=1 Tax=Pisolithus orientalis TaxID=936130 RepID=UPI002223F837|nr:WD40-repeat-containing domain protein [Pisolithus orientalis]KAI6028310.1 WD40-repeat-containing domain protein [Pisolithus orientalis]